jgi:hypothetical protein
MTIPTSISWELSGHGKAGTIRKREPISVVGSPHAHRPSVKLLVNIWLWLPGACGRNNEPIGAMDHPDAPHSLDRYDWFKFGYKLLGGLPFYLPSFDSADIMMSTLYPCLHS